MSGYQETNNTSVTSASFRCYDSGEWYWDVCLQACKELGRECTGFVRDARRCCLKQDVSVGVQTASKGSTLYVRV